MANTDIEEIHRLACARGESTYIDPATGFQVFTSVAHKKRGTCCGFRCRHCPFEYGNAEPEHQHSQPKPPETPTTLAAAAVAATSATKPAISTAKTALARLTEERKCCGGGSEERKSCVGEKRICGDGDNIDTTAAAAAITGEDAAHNCRIRRLHEQACANNQTTYLDPRNGKRVLTALAHLRRGKCCNTGCRHCPFQLRTTQHTSATVTTNKLNSKSEKNNHRTTAKHDTRGTSMMDSSTIVAGLTSSSSDSSTSTKQAHAQPEQERKRNRIQLNGGATAISDNDSITSSGHISTSKRNSKKSRRYRKGIIYTKTGDKGISSLFTGERQSKDSLIFEALGTVDELCATVGYAHSLCTEVLDVEGTLDELELIMCWLFDAGSHIATPRKNPQANGEHHKLATKAATREQLERTHFDPERIKQIEKWMDAKIAILPDLSSFVLPCGGKVASSLHICRTVCRRAERRVLPLANRGAVDLAVLRFINRLSDYLFVLARYMTMVQDEDEVSYMSVVSSQRKANRQSLSKINKNNKNSSMELKKQKHDEHSESTANSKQCQRLLLAHIGVGLVAFAIGCYLL